MSIVVTSIKNPFEPDINVKDIYEFIEGEKLSYYLKHINMDNEDINFIICINDNGIIYEKSDIDNVEILDGDKISVCAKTEAAAAATFFTGFAGIGAAWTAGIGYAIAYGAVYLATSYVMSFALNALASALTPSVDNPSITGSDTSIEQVYGWGSLTQTVGEGNNIPILYGVVRIPGQEINRFTTIDGNKEILNILLGICDHEIDSISDIRINDQPYTYFKGVEVVTDRLGTASDTLIDDFDETITQTDIGSKLTTSSAITQDTTGDAVEKLIIFVTAPNGIYYTANDGGLDTKEAVFTVKYREISSGTWIDHPSSPFTLSGATTSTIRKKITIDSLTAAQYTVEVTRTNAEQTSYRGNSDIYFTSLQEVVKKAFIYPGLAKYAVKVLATDQLSGNIPTLSCIATKSQVSVFDYDLDTPAWNPKRATNPAWIVYSLLVDYAKIDKDRLIWDEFSEWADYCDEDVDGDYRFDVNIILYSGTFWSNIQKVANLGRASVLRRGTRYGVFVDKWEGSSPTISHLFSMGNIKEGSFKLQYLPKKDRAEAVDVEYTDIDKEYTRQIVSVYSLDYITGDSEQKRASVNIAASISEEEAVREGIFRINSNKYLNRVITFDAFIDSFAATVGDLFYFQHMIPDYSIGVGGRIIAAGNGYTPTITPDMVDPDGNYNISTPGTVILTDTSGHAYSSTAFDSGSAILQFKVLQTDAEIKCGLDTAPSANFSPLLMDATWSLDSSGKANTSVSGEMNYAEDNSYTTDSVFSIEYNGSTGYIKFYIDGVLIRTSSQTFSDDLIFYCDLWVSGVIGDGITGLTWATGSPGPYVQIDQSYTIEAAKTYSILVRLRNDSIVEKVINNAAGSTDILTLTTDWDTVPTVVLGSEQPVYSFGEVAYYKKIYRLTSVSRKTDFLRTIVGAEYVPEIYIDNDSYVMNIPLLTIRKQKAINVILHEFLSYETDGSYKSCLNVSWDRAYTIDNGNWSIWLEDTTSGTDPVKVGISFENSFPITSGIVIGNSYKVYISEMNEGAIDTDDNTQTITILGKLAPPDDVIGFSGEWRSIKRQVFFSWNANTEIDLHHYEIRSGSTWAGGTVVANPTTNFTSIFIDEGINTTITYMIKAVDTSGIYSDTEDSDDVAINTADCPLSTPTGLAWTSSTTITSDGRDAVLLLATWTDSSGDNDNFNEFELQLEDKVTGKTSSYFTGNALYQIIIMPNRSYGVKIRSIDISNNKTAWATEVVHTSTKDSTAPDTPTWPTTGYAIAGFKVIGLSWDDNTEYDLSYYVLERSTESDFASDVTVLGNIKASFHSDSYDMEVDTTYYYRLKAVDSSGNASGYSAIVNETTLLIGSTDIAANAIIASKISVDNLAAINANLGTVTAGIVQSSNWGTAAGSKLDLTNDMFTIGGSASPKLYFNGTDLVINAEVTFVSGSSGYSNLSDIPTSLAGINSTEGTKLTGIATGADVTPSLPSDENLVGYWSMDETSGSTISDSSGNGNDGTITGTTSFASGISGNGLDFAAAGGVVDCGSDASLRHTGDKTISLWYRNDDAIPKTVEGNWWICENTVGEASGFLFLIVGGTGCLWFRQSQAGANTSVSSTTAITPGTLQHLCVVVESNNVTFYIDGVDAGGGGAITEEVTATDTFNIGNNSAANSPDGLIDELRIYNKALTAQEIKALYLNPGGNKSQLAAFVAQTTADDAQADADTANGLLTDIAADAKVTPVEKLTLKPIWDSIVTEATVTTGTIPARAIALSVSHTDFDTAYSTLNTLVVTTYTIFTSMTATSNITWATWTAAWTEYYEERQKLLDTIAAKAATLATWSSVTGTGKPADSATNNTAWEHASDSTKIDGGDIYTNSITATQIAAETITAAQIDGRTITAAKMVAGTLTANEMATGTITASSAIIHDACITNLKVAGESYLAGDKIGLSDDIDYNCGLSSHTYSYEITHNLGRQVLYEFIKTSGNCLITVTKRNDNELDFTIETDPYGSVTVTLLYM